MADSGTLTIRIDQSVKERLEQAAETDGRTVTEYVVRAVEQRMAPQCPTCGRSNIPTSIPAAFTPAFDTFLREVKEPPSNGHIPIVLTTLEAGQRCAYWGRLRIHNEDHHGAVVLEIPVGQSMTALPIPRGLITGWGFDEEGHRHGTYRRMGYVDGNQFVQPPQLFRRRS